MEVHIMSLKNKKSHKNDFLNSKYMVFKSFNKILSDRCKGKVFSLKKCPK